MENEILKKMEKSGLDNNFVHIKKIKHENLIKYQQLADLIVCPDIKNIYNELVPHIKVFDSLYSQKPLILPRFKVLEKMFPKECEYINYFTPSDQDDLKDVILNSFKNIKTFKPIPEEYMSQFLYKNLVKSVLNEYKIKGVI